MKCTTLPSIALLVGTTTHAFSTNNRIPTQQQIQHSSTTSLYGKGRRGKLVNNVSLDDDGNVKLISNKQKQKLGSSKGRRSNKKSKDSGEISPLLAEWAKESDVDTISTSSSAESSFDNTAALSKSDIFTSFDDNSNSKKKSKKKSKQGGALLTPSQTTQMDELLTQLTDMISTTNCNVQDIVSKISSLVTLGNSFGNNDSILLPTLKSILSTKPKGDENSPSYRLAWVGSDEAICHIGTSLHKVPLARLQEMYIVLGYNKWELLEVIRILGPFPNVRNTLKGELKVKKLNSIGMGKGGSVSSSDREGVRMEISYNSMVDGTGKEILAGKEDNVKRVELDVWFANEKALVCTVPSEDGDEEDLLSGDGNNLLLFLKENDLDESLEKLRAA